MQAIVYRGMEIPAKVEVADGRDLGMWWEPPSRGCRTRYLPVRAVLLHHTGGEGDAARVYRVLNGGRTNRRSGKPIYLSVHFVIDQTGTITQMADLATVAYHAGRVNDWTVGVEISNIGAGDDARRWPRQEYTCMVHGRTRTDFLRFYPEQVAAAFELTTELTAILGLPHRFPVDAVGEEVSTDVVSDNILSTYHGLLGHLHVSGRKIDPSPHIMAELQARASLP